MGYIKIAQTVMNIDVEHEEIHEGNFYTVEHLFSGVANDAFAYLRIKAGALKNPHIQMFVSTEAKAYYQTYLGTTYSNNGTAITPFNRNTLSTNTCNALVYHTPTVNVLGTLRLNGLVGSGSNPANQIGGAGGGRYETILNNETDLLIAVQNKGGAAKDIAINIGFYEE